MEMSALRVAKWTLISHKRGIKKAKLKNSMWQVLMIVIIPELLGLFLQVKVQN